MRNILIYVIIFTIFCNANDDVKILSETTLSSYVGDVVYRKYVYTNTPISYPIIHENFKEKTITIKKNDLLNINSLVLVKGIYKFHGISYNLDKEGLHRIIDHINKDSIQIIIYNKDILKLLSSFAWITKHGNRDNSKNFKELNKISRRGLLSLTCGAISHYTLAYLKKLHIPTRLIHFNREKDFTGYDDGHLLLEVKINSKWVLVDIDSNTIFYDKKRGFLNAFNVSTEKYGYKKYIKLSSDSYLDSMNFKDKKINYAFLFEEFNLDSWYSNILKILHIYNGNSTLCKKSAHWDEIEKAYGYKSCLEPKIFYKKFYGEKK